MERLNYDIETQNTSSENLKCSGLTESEISYLTELEMKSTEWEKLSLENKIDFVRDVNNRINELSDSTGLSKDSLYKEFFPEIQAIKTRQHSWEGKSVGGVKYSMQVFVSSTGEMRRGVFPEFPARCEICLPNYCMSDEFWKEYGNGSDRMQMKYATIVLKEELIKDPDLKDSLGLNDRQYTDIMDEKDKITGLTWHHDINYGRMKLIDQDIHSMKEHPHSGGMATWNERWIQEHLLRDSYMEKVDENVIFDETMYSKMSPSQLDYIQELLPLKNTDLLIARIDEVNACKPPKAIDSDKGLADMLAPVKTEINPLYLEAPQDFVQIEAISDALTQIEGVGYDSWKELTFDERLDVLQQVESVAAQIAHRPICSVSAKSLGPVHLGYYETGTNHITINSDYISSDSMDTYESVLDTIIHEGRHAYQDYNMNIREAHPRQGDITNWKVNENYGYQDVKHCGFKAYQLQPVESDARAFAEDVLKRYQDRIA